MSANRIQLRSVLVGSVATALAALVALSMYDAYQKRTELAASNQLLASFDRQAVSLDSKLLNQYVGLYKVEPDFNISITLDGERLFAQGSNQRRVEVFPANDATFFNNHTEALITFAHPTNGASQSFILRQSNRLRQGVRI